jgi:aromatic ring-opening dioxygenase LigB subunit
MLNFAALTPHPAILIPTVGKDNVMKLAKTKKAMEDLAKKFDEAQIETLIIISSHAKMHLDAFSILFSPKYFTDFKEFGDLKTRLEYAPDYELTEQIRHTATDRGLRLTLSDGSDLDWSFAVPLYFLAGTRKIKIIPFLHSFSELKDHFDMGQIIKRVIAQTNKRVGVIASGNLSHRSSEKSPAGMSLRGKEFNDKLKELIETKNTAGTLLLDNTLIKEARECIISPLAVLMGVLDKTNYDPEIYSYEAPLGIGHMVCNFKL